jgi:phage FluMu protein Com
MTAEAQSDNTQVISCPHCRKTFAAELIAGGPERHRGFKCPHCKLFVPESRAAEDAPLSRDSAS